MQLYFISKIASYFKEVYKKSGLLSMSSKFECEDQTVSELDNCIFSFDVKVAF